MSDIVARPASSGLVTPIRRAVAALERIPYTLLAIPLRLAAATVFWRSAMTKLPNWETTVFLFEEEYKVPLLPPELAAYMATAVELAAPVMLVLGLATRAATAVLLGMTLVIQVFVYPGAWPTHLLWAAILLVLMARGAGGLSLDALIARRFG
jgi:putative oxidoreductase